jgi:hypothetical protein
MVTKLRSWFLLALAALPSLGCRTSSPPAAAPTAKIEVASGGGYRGPWRMNESRYDYVDDATVAIDAHGVAAVAWVDQSVKDVFFQRFGPDGEPQLAAPVNVSRSPRIFSWLPRMVITSGHPMEVAILWQEIVFSGASHGGEIFFARSTDGGRTFSEPVNLSNHVAGSGKGRLTADRWHNGSLDIVSGPEGNLYVAWTEYEGRLWFCRSTDRGATFSPPALIAGGGDALPTRGPALATDAGGLVHLAWTVGEDPAADIRYARSDDRGESFEPARVVAEGPGHADAPKIAVDSEGTIHLVYAESAAGPFERYEVRYTRSTGGGRFEAPEEISSARGGRFESASFPALSLDGRDRLYVLWELFPSRTGRSQGLGFTHSRDRGQTFAAPSVIPGTFDPALGFNGGQQGLLMRKLAVNADGAIAVVHPTFKAGEESRIWLLRPRVP